MSAFSLGEGEEDGLVRFAVAAEEECDGDDEGEFGVEYVVGELKVKGWSGEVEGVFLRTLVVVVVVVAGACSSSSSSSSQHVRGRTERRKGGKLS